jgi:hypothetical protein
MQRLQILDGSGEAKSASRDQRKMRTNGSQTLTVSSRVERPVSVSFTGSAAISRGRRD